MDMLSFFCSSTRRIGGKIELDTRNAGTVYGVITDVANEHISMLITDKDRSPIMHFDRTHC